MKKKFEAVIDCLISNGEEEPITGINIAEQFCPEETTRKAHFRNLNAAFLISLCGSSHPLYSEAERFTKDLRKQPDWKGAVDFFCRCRSLTIEEIEERCAKDRDFRESLDQLYLWVRDPRNLNNRIETMKKVWEVFSPEGVSLFEQRENKISALRKKRTVRITRLNPDPIKDPANEILFTSNVLLTVPSPTTRIDNLALPEHMKSKLHEIMREPQIYWYDHPIQIGVESEKNEVIYGLKGLDQSVEFEKKVGVVEKDTKVHCILSVSVTHAGLHDIARAYLEDVLRKEKSIKHLNVYILTESDATRLIDETLNPAARHYLDSRDENLLNEIIGVDGKYGRHYSFLKAISAFWQVFINSDVRGTFKIDLDQVFPQNELVRETGASAFEHFKTPLWGAEGLDENDNRIELGMIAGALVNEEDIGRSLFTPDVSFPSKNICGNEWIFYSPLPQALSTEAEMMTRYGEGELNGRDRCIQRVHVTGGTCGILVESLRRYRPFTPTFIGRAEDQAYILSVLLKEESRNLRYAHESGLIMRHDKKSFAGEAIKSAHTGKLIGDYTRILLFSYYAKALPWSVEQTKDIIDPFTGCFVSYIPFTLASLRLALKGASFFKDRKPNEGFDLLQMGINRLNEIIKKLSETSNPLRERFRKEKKAWNIFYDFLDKVEEGLKRSDPFALDLKEKAKELIKTSEIDLRTLSGH
ncbi:MAG: hypothetical protein B1H12_08795 [Desulfobacteraceae bacterium 4484_190.2]|nr:MAG: hypothetical protein B1H12_08795 [Desulfobacteraceae bacterium 4484_190.2]